MSKEILLNDNELVQRFIAGDQNSLEILIQRHKGRVFSYIILIVKKQELAEDIFQETFIKVIRSLKKGKYTQKTENLFPGFYAFPIT
jgi:DNA-directed RNA polymerase specialized sigma24 family protein